MRPHPTTAPRPTGLTSAVTLVSHRTRPFAFPTRRCYRDNASLRSRFGRDGPPLAARDQQRHHAPLEQGGRAQKSAVPHPTARSVSADRQAPSHDVQATGARQPTVSQGVLRHHLSSQPCRSPNRLIKGLRRWPCLVVRNKRNDFARPSQVWVKRTSEVDGDPRRIGRVLFLSSAPMQPHGTRHSVQHEHQSIPFAPAAPFLSTAGLQATRRPLTVDRTYASRQPAQSKTDQRLAARKISTIMIKSHPLSSNSGIRQIFATSKGPIILSRALPIILYQNRPGTTPSAFAGPLMPSAKTTLKIRILPQSLSNSARSSRNLVRIHATSLVTDANRNRHRRQSGSMCR